MLRIECHHIITATCCPHEVPTETDTVCGTIAGDMNLKRSCSSETYLSDDCMYVHTSEAVCSDEQGYIYIYSQLLELVHSCEILPQRSLHCWFLGWGCLGL